MKTPSRLQVLLDNKTRTLDEANELIDLLANFLATTNQSVLQIRDEMGLQKGAIETIAGVVGLEPEGAATKLIGFDQPKIVTN